jgi:hypothetical protein
LADLHLTDNFNTVKMPVLEWALQELKNRQCDCICCIGDLTAQGSDKQTAEVLKRLNSCGVPFCSTPGNAEVRIYQDGRNADKFNIPAPAGVPVILIDTTFNEPSTEDLVKLAALPDNASFLLATHNPVQMWSQKAQDAVKAAMERRAVTFDMAGHSHHDEANILRGLDPDKASGGVPMFAVMERNADGLWQRSDVNMPGVDPGEWCVAEREELIQNIGISTMWEELAALEFAVQHKICHVELRMKLAHAPELQQAIERWRSCCGETLSLHLPDLKLHDEENNLKKFAALADELGCDRVTLHVPRVTAAEFDAAKDQLLEKFAADLQILLEKKTVIGIENLHTSAQANTFETRNFGCNIEECRRWVELLREKFSTDRIGFHLDIGHCRNNAPISGKENLSDWYCCMGYLVNGWHLHQVGDNGGVFSNHQPLCGFYDKLISLGGLFMALRAGQLKKAPMFLESRTWDGNVQAYGKLMAGALCRTAN